MSLIWNRLKYLINNPEELEKSLKALCEKIPEELEKSDINGKYEVTIINQDKEKR